MASVPPPPSNPISVGPVIPPNITVLVGPILIGNFVGWLLLGVLTMQLYVYYICFPKDRWWIKFSAYALYLLDLVQTAFVTDVAWIILCEGWGNPTALMHTSWTFSMTPLVSGMISGWVQIFFAWRVLSLGHSSLWTVVTVVIIAFAFAQTGAAIATGIKFAEINNIQKIHDVNNVVAVWLAGSAIADLLIAASMVYFLASASRKAMWNNSTNKRITKLIRSIVETGVLSAAAASLDLGLFLGFPNNNLHVAIAIVLSKLYSNALMASLNSRAGVYDRPLLPSSSRGEDTSGYFNTAQFTSVGIALTTDDTVSTSETGINMQNAKSDGEQGLKLKTGRLRAGIPMVNLGTVH